MQTVDGLKVDKYYTSGYKYCTNELSKHYILSFFNYNIFFIKF